MNEQPFDMEDIVYITTIGGIPDFISRGGVFAVTEHTPARPFFSGNSQESPRMGEYERNRLRINLADADKAIRYFKENKAVLPLIGEVEYIPVPK